MIKLNFDEIPGFSKLFCDFLKKNSFFEERFVYLENLLSNSYLIDKKLNSYTNRKIFKKIVGDCNSKFDLSEEQLKNLKLIDQDNTLVVVAGQQPGIYGGPLYTFYKTLTAIKTSQMLKEKFPIFNFVPIFWIEDNDHDCVEAFQVVLLDKKNDVLEIPIEEKCINNLKNSLSEYVISTKYSKLIESYLFTNSEDESNPTFSKFLLELFDQKDRLVDTFQSIHNYLFKDFGLLFVAASEFRKQKAFAEILSREFENFGTSFTVIETANHLIRSQGYHIQAKNSLPNLFFHSDKRRAKVEWNTKNKMWILDDITISEKDIIMFFEKNQDKFSPNVLLRPICQDYLLPNIASVLGPSEIGYTTQLKELYAWYGITMPTIIPRHSITFLHNKYMNILEEYGINFLFKPKKEIEEKIYNANRNLLLQDEIKGISAEFSEIFSRLKEIGSKLDKSLNISGEAHFTKSFRQLESYVTKIFSAEKRNIIQKHKEVFALNNLLFPNGTLQERSIATIFPILQFGENNFQKKIMEIVELPPFYHFVVSI